jgi:hypothetical protein
VHASDSCHSTAREGLSCHELYPANNLEEPLSLTPGRYDIEQNGEKVGNAASQHEDMPDCMVVREAAPGVETEPQGLGQISNQ